MSKADKLQDYSYENRWVAFIDILGFSNHVVQSEMLAKVHELIDVVRELKKSGESYLSKYDSLLLTETMKVTAFSDNIVISAEYGELHYVIQTTGLLCRELLDKGYMARGAIAYGKLHHSDDVIVGPGLVKAYQFESEVAHYPRIIFDESKIDEVINESVVFEIIKDSDGIYYLDYLQRHQPVGDEVCAQKIYEQLEGTLLGDSLKLKSKANWMKNYLDRHMDCGNLKR